ncbi:hypothetical protein AB0C33_28840 [Nonomuraea sp. NPDC048881]|uniref:hypothetical protein n=1 Tax=Nonomuraea sp. NPDC048881 TaxID=3155030 RepID=UPI0033D4151A
MREFRFCLHFRSCLHLARERHARPLRSLEFRPVGTNGYVSTWGVIAGIRPPQVR